ncbi:hypothetical protein VW35_00940 [Devosia soli]|uniref:Uncharacterized protein n=1 Tax=Devosia soli TaxID=361041 RepID=A0A0F5LGV4_9HYPH|nr:hypothetical protein [Devosia soli]KKB80807.1 hypothetical protein VW35_00940 [Devosia soli]
MSAADDIYEMKSLCEQIAGRLATSSSDKDRVTAIYEALKAKVTWNRAFEFLKGKARRIDSWEKDLARAKLQELKRLERERQALQHVAWLQSIRSQAEEAGSDMDRADLAAVERVLSRIGVLDRPLGNPDAAFTDADERADQSTDWGH